MKDKKSEIQTEGKYIDIEEKRDTKTERERERESTSHPFELVGSDPFPINFNAGPPGTTAQHLRVKGARKVTASHFHWF